MSSLGRLLYKVRIYLLFLSKSRDHVTARDRLRSGGTFFPRLFRNMQKGARQLTRQILQLSYARSESTSFSRSRRFVSSTARRRNSVPDVDSSPGNDPARKASTLTRPEHAVVSAFGEPQAFGRVKTGSTKVAERHWADLFSIGVGPSSSHTVG